MAIPPPSLLVLALVAHVCLGSYLHISYAQQCSPNGQITGVSGDCNTDNNADCCVNGQMYDTYSCSPPVTGETQAHMTINSFAEGGDGGGPSECDGSYHSDGELVVALSTGWYDDGSRCNKNITINANGRSVLAMVVDECDSVYGCEAEQNFQPPCGNNIISASPAVWKALAIPEARIGYYDVTWSDA
ncbi:ripening-related protein [Musa troglodytarum]|uniref:Ripening-related protein n=1 Tax=Musa troglodytarum TaxID=320322 RepID=A0A9E7JVJ8_9LILI|nr:ripening-related protein [Musa troglodytarum]